MLIQVLGMGCPKCMGQVKLTGRIGSLEDVKKCLQK